MEHEMLHKQENNLRKKILIWSILGDDAEIKSKSRVQWKESSEEKHLRNLQLIAQTI